MELKKEPDSRESSINTTLSNNEYSEWSNEVNKEVNRVFIVSIII